MRIDNIQTNSGHQVFKRNNQVSFGYFKFAKNIPMAEAAKFEQGVLENLRFVSSIESLINKVLESPKYHLYLDKQNDLFYRLRLKKGDTFIGIDKNPDRVAKLVAVPDASKELPKHVELVELKYSKNDIGDNESTSRTTFEFYMEKFIENLEIAKKGLLPWM